MSFRGLRAGLVAAALGFLTLAASASAATLRGVVVQHNRHAHSFTIALKSGHLISVHASSSSR
jgi:hypothetical protein